MSVHSLKGRNVHNPNWLAPEIMMKDTEYTERADVYSYAIILWYLSPLTHSHTTHTLFL